MADHSDDKKALEEIAALLKDLPEDEAAAVIINAMLLPTVVDWIKDNSKTFSVMEKEMSKGNTPLSPDAAKSLIESTNTAREAFNEIIDHAQQVSKSLTEIIYQASKYIGEFN